MALEHVDPVRCASEDPYAIVPVDEVGRTARRTCEVVSKRVGKELKAVHAGRDNISREASSVDTPITHVRPDWHVS